ncbi:MAG: dihydrodipicolinate synthase family protein, partial [Fusobacteriaceae bacterium]
AGFDEMLMPALTLGVDGAIGSTYNVTGKIAREIYNLTKENKIPDALKVQGKLNDVIEKVLANGIYQTLKTILEEKGVQAGHCRLPMKKITAEKQEKAREIAKNYL